MTLYYKALKTNCQQIIPRVQEIIATLHKK